MSAMKTGLAASPRDPWDNHGRPDHAFHQSSYPGSLPRAVGGERPANSAGRAMVDAMPNRGPADQLIAPLRDRLARLRPPRTAAVRAAAVLAAGPADRSGVPLAARTAHDPAHRDPGPGVGDGDGLRRRAGGRSIATMIQGRTTRGCGRRVEERRCSCFGLGRAGAAGCATVPDGWETTDWRPGPQPLTRRIGALLSQAGAPAAR